MSAQLTLQAPLELPPADLTSYLERLWSGDLAGSNGAATFTLVVWDPAWLEQHLIRTGRLDGPITGLLSAELLEAARTSVAALDLPPSTAPMDPGLAWRLYTPLLALIEEAPWRLPVHPYEARTWGPAAADSLLADDGLSWRRP